MSALIKDSWILISASAFNLLLQYVVLVEEYEEICPHTGIVGTEKSILISFLDNSGYSSLIFD